MNRYDIALFIHLLSLLLAATATVLTTFGAVRLRDVTSVGEAGEWLRLVGKAVPLFPLAILGLVGTGVYMTEARWSWSAPWIQAAVLGLGMIVLLGSGIEANRGKVLRRELATSGLSLRARRLLRDPVSWTAKVLTQTLVIAVVFVMTMKPAAPTAFGALALALIAGAVGAMPLWRGRGGGAATAAELSNASSP